MKLLISFVNLPILKDENIDIINYMHINDCVVLGTKFKELFSKGFNMKDIGSYPLLMLK